MRRPASRLGMPTLSVLSIVLTLGSLAVVPSSAQAAPAATGSVAATGAKGTDRSTARPTLRRAGAAAARAAADVELSRPLRGERAVRELGDQLDEAAALNDLTEAELTELLTTDPTAWLDRDGYVFFKDEPAVAPGGRPGGGRGAARPDLPAAQQARLDEDDLPRLRRRHARAARPGTPATRRRRRPSRRGTPRATARPSPTPSSRRSRRSGSRWPRTTRPSTST